jgi:hypothetical protein
MNVFGYFVDSLQFHSTTEPSSITGTSGQISGMFYEIANRTGIFDELAPV